MRRVFFLLHLTKKYVILSIVKLFKLFEQTVLEKLWFFLGLFLLSKNLEKIYKNRKEGCKAT